MSREISNADGEPAPAREDVDRAVRINVRGRGGASMRKGLLSMVLGAVAAVAALLAVVPAALAVETGPAPQAGPIGLPEGRVYEEVSPPIKYGGEAGYSKGAATLQRWPLYSVASANGDRILFTQNGAFGETASGLDLYGVASWSAGSGWKTRAALPPITEEPNGGTDLPFDFTPSASLQNFVWTSGKPYVAGTNAESPAGRDTFGSPNLYLTRGTSEVPSGVVEPAWLARPQLANIAPPLGELTNEDKLAVAGASPSLSRVYFSYLGTLTPADESREPHVSEKATGFYEWAGGSLHEAGVLPDGALDAYGSEPASVETTQPGAEPESYDNQVAAEGERAFFLSPSREAASACSTAKYTGPGGCVPEIYARIHHGGETRVVLVSRDELTHGAAPEAPQQFHSPGVRRLLTSAYAAPDGSRVFFMDKARLTAAAPENTSEKVYEDNLSANGGEGEVVYRAGLEIKAVFGGILGTSANGRRVLFLQDQKAPRSIALWELNAAGEEVVTPIAEAPAVAKVDSVRATQGGTAFVFATNAKLKTFGEKPQVFNAPGKYVEVYRYGAQEAGGTLDCLSCQGSQAPEGDAKLSNDDGEYIFPSEGTLSHFKDTLRTVDTRAMNREATEVFFDTPQALAPQDVNGTRDVYEWRAAGTGPCAPSSTAGCVYLISSGTSPNETFLLDNSENGNNVFFATTAALASEDTEGGYDIYDARVSEGTTVTTGFAPCGESCQVNGAPATLPQLLSAAVGASGNATARAVTRSGGHKAAKEHANTRKAKARKRRHKRARCIKRAKRRRNAGRRRRALRRCRARFGAKSARRRHGRRRGRGRREHGHGHGKRRRG